MQMSDSGSDAEMEVDEVNQKLQDENDDNEAEEEKLKPEDEEEEPEHEQEDVPESEEASPPPSPPKQPCLKIKLKLPSVPSTEDTGSRGCSGDIDVESEDEDDEGEAVGSTRPMTSRQVVLASVVGSLLVRKFWVHRRCGTMKSRVTTKQMTAYCLFRHGIDIKQECMQTTHIRTIWLGLPGHRWTLIQWLALPMRPRMT
ncbi:hypothetical protein F4604DRAFT_1116869 [Suillus subluteus]|nr:hypothetical protein F4604DRAFT_1116869 [Suillus subluteus]